MTEYDLDFPALACGIARDEGVVVAYIPKNQDGVILMESTYRDGKRAFTVFSLDGVAIDAKPHDTGAMKWWMVREAARALRLEFIEPIFACAAEDFRVSSLPQVPKPADHVLAFRQYNRGPWIKLEPDPDKETNGNSTTVE